ncbi:MAG: hypothetical protein OXE44_00095 [Nitrospinae bacterium]|nr:hypothetical protein [Nitrospinota bacterium]
MEFIKMYAMAGLPVLFVFAAIWWFMTSSIIHQPRAKAAQSNDARIALVETKLLDAINPESELRKAA